MPPVSGGATQGTAGLLSLASTATSSSEAVSNGAAGAGTAAQGLEMGGRFTAGRAALAPRATVQWLPRDDSLPEAHRQVSFLELALDFESHAGRPLPPGLETTFVGTEMSVQEKGQVIRLATSL